MKIKITFLITLFFNVSTLFSQANVVIPSNNSTFGKFNVLLGNSSGINIPNDPHIYGNIFVGHRSGFNTTTGISNVFLGYRNGESNTTGSGNTYVGYQSGIKSVESSFNTYLGYQSDGTGSRNIAIGFLTGKGNDGNDNILIGYEAGYCSPTKSNSGNVLIGFRAGKNAEIKNKFMVKGNITYGELIYGDFEKRNIDFNGRVGINLTYTGNPIPGNALEVKGLTFNSSGIRFTNLNSNYNPPVSQSATKFLTVDINGDVVLQNLSNLETDNVLNSVVNIMNSKVNNILSSTNIINSLSNSINSGNQLITTVNGVQSNPVNLQSTNVTAGANVTVTGNGSVGTPFIVSSLDNQNLTLTGNTLSIGNGNSVVLPSANVTAGANVTVTGNGSVGTPFIVSSLDNQNLSLTGNTLSIGNGNSVILPSANVTAGTNVTVTGNGSVTTPFIVSSLDNQNLTLTGNTLSIGNGNSVVLPSANVTAGTNVTVTGNGSVTTPFIVSSLDNQNLSLTGNTLSIGNGNSVVLPAYIDTDAQSLSIAGNNISISNGNTITIPSTSVTAGTNVSVTGNGSATSPFVVSSINNNTDNQNLTVSGNTISISGGNTISLPTISVISGSNVTVSGNGTASSPFQINAIDTSLYSNNGIINQSTTTGMNRVVDMNDRNIWFNTSSSSANGKMYIGSSSVYPTTTGDYKLFVEGGILTEKVKVALRSTGNWADYVFESDYKLMPLKDVEQFITKNNHLPGIDSAEELSKNGLDVAEMQSKQMAKIEELTLYIIEQNKKLEIQNNAIQNHSKEIEELKLQFAALTEKIK